MEKKILTLIKHQELVSRKCMQNFPWKIYAIKTPPENRKPGILCTSHRKHGQSKTIGVFDKSWKMIEKLLNL